MTPDFTKKPTLNPLVIEKLTMVLTSFGVPTDIIDKIKSILGGNSIDKTDAPKSEHTDEETPEEDKTDTTPEDFETDVSSHDPKKKLSLNGVKVVCISE